MLDSGASRHFISNLDDFIEWKPIKPTTIYTANGKTAMTGVGTVIFSVADKIIQISPVYYTSQTSTTGFYPSGYSLKADSQHGGVLAQLH